MQSDVEFTSASVVPKFCPLPLRCALFEVSISPSAVLESNVSKAVLVTPVR